MSQRGRLCKAGIGVGLIVVVAFARPAMMGTMAAAGPAPAHHGHSQSGDHAPQHSGAPMQCCNQCAIACTAVMAPAGVTPPAFHVGTTHHAAIRVTPQIGPRRTQYRLPFPLGPPTVSHS